MYINKFTFKAILTLMAIMMFSNLCSAQDKLYEVALPISAPTEEERVKVLPDAFKMLITKLTGKEIVPQNPSLTQAFTNIDSYVTKFFFSELNTNQHQITLTFNEVMVQALLEKAGLHVLSPSRPITVIGILQEKQEGLEWLSVEDMPPLKKILHTFCEQNGLLIIVPLLDLEDLANLNAKNIDDISLVDLHDPLQRYGANAALLLKVHEDAYEVKGEMIMLLPDSPERQTIRGDNLNKAFEAALEQFKMKIFNHGGSKTTLTATTTKEETQEVTIAVEGIHSPIAYTKVLTYLKSIPWVHNAEISQVLPTQTVFTVSGNLSRDSLAHVLSQGTLLTPIKESNIADQILIFKMAP